MRNTKTETSAVDRMQAAPLYHQIFLQLREEITGGQRALGSRMPTEQELALQYSVSRITARRALDELAQNGLVERKRRVGTTVIFTPPVAPIEGSMDRALEGLLNFGRSTQVRLLELETIPAPAPIAEALAVPVGSPVVRVVRVRLLDGRPLGHFVSFIPAGLGVKLTRSALRSTPMLSLIEQAGIQVGAANQTISATLADLTLSSTLDVDIGSPILRVSRTVFDADQRPVQHLLAQFRPDRYQIKLDLSSQMLEPSLL